MLFKNITEITPKIIKVLIDKSSTEHARIKSNYERYKQTKEGVPILNRKYTIDGVEQTDKINNKIANDFVGEIIDMKVGFFCGVPISYVLDKTKYQTEKVIKNVVNKVKSVFTGKEPQKETIISSKFDTDMDVINDFNRLNAIPDLDVETSKRSSICGYCGRQLYIDLLDGKPVQKVKLIEPWECIFVGDSIEKPTWTIRYYDTITYDDTGKEIKVSHAELYSKDKVTFYILNDGSKEYTVDSTKEEIIYYWQDVPLFGFANNDEMLGDADKVLDEIDAYDRTVSDINSELEQFRLAYLKFTNCSIDANVIKTARQTGAFSLPGDSNADFITKNLNDAVIEHHLDRLERNIYRFSETPNMNDISFAGNLTGVAMKYKFRPFEDKCKRSELKFKKALDSQFEKVCRVWAESGMAIDPLWIDYIFTRNYPQNLPEEIQMLRDSKGIISEKTRFSLVSFITDPEKEIEQLKLEEQENLDNFIERNNALKDGSDKDEEKQDVTMQGDIKQSISNEAK